MQLVADNFFRTNTGRRKVSPLPHDSDPIFAPIAVRQISHSLKNLRSDAISNHFFCSFQELKSFFMIIKNSKNILIY